MTAIVLAAGFSRRFGRKKLLMDINRKTMIAHVVDVVLSMDFDDSLLVYHDEEVKKAVANRNIRCVYNGAAADGLSTSVKCGIENSKAAEAYIFFPGDQPFIDRKTVEELLTAYSAGKGSIIVPTYDGCRGNPVIFSSIWRDKLECITGDTGGREIIKANARQVHYVEISNLKAGMDIDTWGQYSEYIGGIGK